MLTKSFALLEPPNKKILGIEIMEFAPNVENLQTVSSRPQRVFFSQGSKTHCYGEDETTKKYRIRPARLELPKGGESRNWEKNERLHFDIYFLTELIERQYRESCEKDILRAVGSVGVEWCAEEVEHPSVFFLSLTLYVCTVVWSRISLTPARSPPSLTWHLILNGAGLTMIKLSCLLVGTWNSHSSLSNPKIKLPFPFFTFPTPRFSASTSSSSPSLIWKGPARISKAHANPPQALISSWWVSSGPWHSLRPQP